MRNALARSDAETGWKAEVMTQEASARSGAHAHPSSHRLDLGGGLA